MGLERTEDELRYLENKIMQQNQQEKAEIRWTTVRDSQQKNFYYRNLNKMGLEWLGEHE